MMGDTFQKYAKRAVLAAFVLFLGLLWVIIVRFSDTKAAFRPRLLSSHLRAAAIRLHEEYEASRHFPVESVCESETPSGRLWDPYDRGKGPLRYERTVTATSEVVRFYSKRYSFPLMLMIADTETGSVTRTLTEEYEEAKKNDLGPEARGERIPYRAGLFDYAHYATNKACNWFFGLFDQP